MRTCRITDKNGKALAIIIIAYANDHKLAVIIHSPDMIERNRQSYQNDINDETIIEELISVLNLTINDVIINCN